MNEVKQKKKTERPAQIILILRLVASGYLVYLAFGLIKEVPIYTGGRQILLLAGMLVFFSVGTALGGWTIKKLLRGEFLRPWESAEDFED